MIAKGWMRSCGLALPMLIQTTLYRGTSGANPFRPLVALKLHPLNLFVRIESRSEARSWVRRGSDAARWFNPTYHQPK